MLDEWIMRNAPITMADSEKLATLRYYLNVQLKFYREVSIGKSILVKYLKHIKLLKTNLISIGVADSGIDSEMKLLYRTINTTIDVLEDKLGL